MRYRKYTDKDVQIAVKTSTSIRQVLSKLDLATAGGNYQSLHNLIDTLSLDTSHFTGSAWSKGKTIGVKHPIEDYLANTFTIHSHKL